MVPGQALRQKAIQFESKVYSQASSRTDYLQRITEGLRNLARRVTLNATYVTPQQAALSLAQQTRQQKTHGSVEQRQLNNPQAIELQQKIVNRDAMSHIPPAAEAVSEISMALPPNPASAFMVQGPATYGNTTEILQQMRMQQQASTWRSNDATIPSNVASARRVSAETTMSKTHPFMEHCRIENSVETREALDCNRSFGRNQHTMANQKLIPPRAGASEVFWEKLEGMKVKYREPLMKMHKYIEMIVNRLGPEKKKNEQFKKQVISCFRILKLSRGDTVPSQVTITFLDKVCNLLDKLINASKKLIVKQNASSSASRQGPAPSSAASSYGLNEGGGTGVPHNTVLHNLQLAQTTMETQHQMIKQQSGLAAMGIHKPGREIVGTRKDTASDMRSRDEIFLCDKQQSRFRPTQRAQIGIETKAKKSGCQALHSSSFVDLTGDEKRLSDVRKRHHVHQEQVAQTNTSVAEASGIDRAATVRFADAHAVCATSVDREMIPKLWSEKVNGSRKHSKDQLSYADGKIFDEGSSPSGDSQEFADALIHEDKIEDGMASKAKPVTIVSAATHTSWKKSKAYLEQRLIQMSAMVKNSHDSACRLEQAVVYGMDRSKAERIQSTLFALVNLNSTSALVSGVGTKRRYSSLTDEENCSERDKMICAKSLFQCSSKQVVRSTKRTKIDGADRKFMRQVVEEECKAVQERNPVLALEMREEFGNPVVECMLLIEEIKVPKLVLRVSRGYPSKGGVAYEFERPPLGWVGVLVTIRDCFKARMSYAPKITLGISDVLEAWAHEAQSAAYLELCSCASDDSDSDVQLNHSLSGHH